MVKSVQCRFQEIVDRVPTIVDGAEEDSGPTYLIGESLRGEGNEVAHIDLMIGDKNGPIGQAFANGMSQLSAGHTPVLAVIRPNLPPKLHTLIFQKSPSKTWKTQEKFSVQHKPQSQKPPSMREDVDLYRVHTE